MIFGSIDYYFKHPTAIYFWILSKTCGNGTKKIQNVFILMDFYTLEHKKPHSNKLGKYRVAIYHTNTCFFN